MYSRVMTLWQPKSGDVEQHLFAAIFATGAALETEPSDSNPSNPFAVCVSDVVARVGINPATIRLREFFNPWIEKYNSGLIG